MLQRVCACVPGPCALAFGKSSVAQTETHYPARLAHPGHRNTSPGWVVGPSGPAAVREWMLARAAGPAGRRGPTARWASAATPAASRRPAARRIRRTTCARTTRSVPPVVLGCGAALRQSAGACTFICHASTAPACSACAGCSCSAQAVAISRAVLSISSTGAGYAAHIHHPPPSRSRRLIWTPAETGCCITSLPAAAVPAELRRVQQALSPRLDQALVANRAFGACAGPPAPPRPPLRWRPHAAPLAPPLAVDSAVVPDCRHRRRLLIAAAALGGGGCGGGLLLGPLRAAVALWGG